MLDCLRREPHPTHLAPDQAVELARRLAPRRALFTHMCHRLEHEAVCAELPPGMELAYDGLRIPLGSGTMRFVLPQAPAAPP